MCPFALFRHVVLASSDHKVNADVCVRLGTAGVIFNDASGLVTLHNRGTRRAVVAHIHSFPWLAFSDVHYVRRVRPWSKPAHDINIIASCPSKATPEANVSSFSFPSSPSIPLPPQSFRLFSLPANYRSGGAVWIKSTEPQPSIKLKSIKCNMRTKIYGFMPNLTWASCCLRKSFFLDFYYIKTAITQHMSFSLTRIPLINFTW